MDISVLCKVYCYLGESPLWHQLRKSCIWVDIEKQTVYELRWDTRQLQRWDINRRVSVAIEDRQGRIILGVQGGLMRLDLDNGKLEWLMDIEPLKPESRCNDAIADVSGRIWIGVMHIAAKAGEGGLFFIDQERRVQNKINGLTIPNGMAWSADQKHFYFVHSTERSIKSFKYDQQSGNITFERVAILIPEAMGIPDGITIDEDGMLWVALYGGFGVSRWNPRSGELLSEIKLPVPNVTSCCFVGNQLEHLMITTAREGLPDEDLVLYPESGDVYLLTNPGVKGVKAHKANY